MDKAITEITYHFGDSSVPPPYHRSYSIVLTKDSVAITVDSYGEVLAEAQYAVDEDTFNKVLKVLEQSNFKNCKSKQNDGCTGGTSESVTFKNKEESVFQGSVYHCGGKDYGNLEGDIKTFAQTMKALIPNLSELLK